MLLLRPDATHLGLGKQWHKVLQCDNTLVIVPSAVNFSGVSVSLPDLDTGDPYRVNAPFPAQVVAIRDEKKFNPTNGEYDVFPEVTLQDNEKKIVFWGLDPGSVVVKEGQTLEAGEVFAKVTAASPLRLTVELYALFSSLPIDPTHWLENCIENDK